MEDKIYGLMESILKLDGETLKNNADSGEVWNSLVRVEILFAIEDEFNIQFSEEELVKLDTPRKLCEAVVRKAQAL